MNDMREVRFDQYCEKCKHWEKREDEDPCFDCLDRGWNTDSHKPIYFEEGETKNEREGK